MEFIYWVQWPVCYASLLLSIVRNSIQSARNGSCTRSGRPTELVFVQLAEASHSASVSHHTDTALRLSQSSNSCVAASCRWRYLFVHTKTYLDTLLFEQLVACCCELFNAREHWIGMLFACCFVVVVVVVAAAAAASPRCMCCCCLLFVVCCFFVVCCLLFVV